MTPQPSHPKLEPDHNDSVVISLEEKLNALDDKYRRGVLKMKEMMGSSQTPGAYMGYKAQGELMGMFLFEINELRENPKPLDEVLP